MRLYPLILFLLTLFLGLLIHRIYQTNPEFLNYRQAYFKVVTEPYLAPATHFKELESQCKPTAQYRYNETRKGVAPNTATPRIKTKILKIQPLNLGSDNISKSSPIVDDSGVYVGSDTGWFLKLNHDGDIVWRFYIPGSNGIYGSAALDDKKVYIGADNGFFYALDKTNGDLVWANPVADSIGASALLGGGDLFISATTSHPDGFMVRLDCNRGETLWVSPWFGGPSASSPVYDKNNKQVLVGANSGRFYAFHEESGKTAWEIQTHGQIKGTAMIHKDQVFFSSWGKNYYGLDLKTGKKNWHSFMGGKIQTSLSLVPGENMGITNTPLGEIIGVRLKDGSIAWRLRHGDGNSMFSLLITKHPNGKNHLAWSRCKKFQLCTLDARTGKLIHNRDLPGSFTSVPFAYGSRIYISLDKHLLILE